jgi:hypothetical protein
MIFYQNGQQADNLILFIQHPSRELIVGYSVGLSACFNGLGHERCGDAIAKCKDTIREGLRAARLHAASARRRF